MKYIIWIWFLAYAALYYVLIFYFMFHADQIKSRIKIKVGPKFESMAGIIYFLLFMICFANLCVIVKYTSDIYNFIYHWYYDIGLPIK